MSEVTTGTENDSRIQLHNKDHGSSPPVLIHHKPLDRTSLQREVLANGVRVITCTRYGVGQSTQPRVRSNYVAVAAPDGVWPIPWPW